MAIRSSISFTTRLAIGIALVNLLVFALVAQSLHQDLGQYRERAQISSRNLAQVLQQNVCTVLDRIDLVLAHVAEEFERTGMNERELELDLAGIARHLPDVANMGFTNAAGDLVALVGAAGNGRISLADREYFQKLRDDPDTMLVVSKAMKGRITGRWQVVVARRLVHADKSFAGVVYAVVLQSHFVEMFSKVDVGEHGAILMVDNNYDLIARHPIYPGNDNAIGQPVVSQEFRALIKINPITATYTAKTGLDHRQRTTTYHKIGPYFLTIIAALAVDDYLAGWRADVVRMLGQTALFSLTTLLLFLMIHRSWLRAEASLGEALAAKATLEDLSNLNASVISASTVGILAYRADGSCIIANDAAVRITGGTVEQMKAQNFRKLESWSRSGLLAAAEAALTTGESCHLTTQVTTIYGKRLWMECDFRPFAMGGVRHLMMIVRDISEQKQAEAELARSNAELDQFAYMASHDLREPLRTVTSYLQLLTQSAGGRLTDDEREFIGFALSGAQRMLALIKDLLEYSRIGAKGQQLAPTDCRQAVDAALANLGTLVEECGAAVVIGDMPVVMADRTQLVRLFQNLIDNALKYRDPDRPPLVRLSARRDGKGWVISVNDNGIGIESKYFERIFIIFQRLHSYDKYDGTGIGLAACKKIVERHGGRIWLESMPGVGSTFIFTLAEPVNHTGEPKD
ncbi:MAG: PAS domain S-box protein [Alphaproteobacteria bacterium]|nr:PAS domain S-box protein [Alphaproteobacteria bacterium]